MIFCFYKENTMKKLIPLSLQGCGYIEDLEWNDQEATLRIQVIPVGAHRSSSQITLDCQILPRLKEKVRQLDRQCPVTGGVMIWFTADFSAYATSFPVMDSATPEDIVMLKGELRAITGWRQDTTGLHPLR
jgi:hypothetical protein